MVRSCPPYVKWTLGPKNGFVPQSICDLLLFKHDNKMQIVFPGKNFHKEGGIKDNLGPGEKEISTTTWAEWNLFTT